ncbi:MAG: UDP-N-acetylmuramoyl-L-alanine--D-glutamate ligase [Thermodesulfovibrionia bacterium]|nr:UDP-N-acetylmuramoyl-L-alanine--D-glutamate ligase [Thermodesulfovibrionia bacterium]
MENFKFKDRKVLVVGLARSGVGSANLLSSFGAKVSVTDVKSYDFLADDIKKLAPSVEVIAGGHPEEIFSNSDLIVVSPGVPPDIPPLIHAKGKGIPVIGELELAYQIVMSDELRVMSKKQNTKMNSLPITHHALPAFIGITGTNGKSTTTTLIDLMLKRAGFKTLLAGNIGNALTEELNKLRVESEELKIDYIVTEISSFQLETIRDFRPFVALILNITPDHLNRYRSMEEYIDAKANIFKNQGPDDYLILNADDPTIMELYKSKVKTQKSKLRNINVLFFSRKTEVQGIYYKNGGLLSNLLSTPGTTPSGFLRKGVVPPFHIITTDEIKIKGVHNLENSMAASLAALICGCSAEAIRDVLKDFSGLEHRLEFVCEIDGVSFINDSKGTNVGAVVKSLEGLKNIVLIMGGRDKDGDFTVLKDLVKKKVKALILLGEAKEKIAKALEGAADTVFVKDIKEAVEMSMSKASAGDAVLLSPGCASFDMFADFEDRGRKFKEAVKQITEHR